MKSLLKLSLLITSLAFVTACSDDSFVNTHDRQVPLSDTEPSSSSEINPHEEPAKAPTDDVIATSTVETNRSSLVSLREKVLATSNVSETALDNAFDYYDKNHAAIRNKKYVTIFDIGKFSGKRRLFIINMDTGKVSSLHVAHGKKSDRDHDGYATSFSNTSGSNKSSLGFMLTAERYFGRNGLSMRLDGQERRNSRVRSRAIVVHGANYVNTSSAKKGRSLGCPAVTHGNIKWMVKALENGSLFYIYHKRYDG